VLDDPVGVVEGVAPVELPEAVELVELDAAFSPLELVSEVAAALSALPAASLSACRPSLLALVSAALPVFA
jgi:hypothetical protein